MSKNDRPRLMIQPVPGSEWYMVTDGVTKVEQCPCCLRPMTLKAATHLLHNVRELDIDLPAIKAMFERIRVI